MRNGKTTFAGTITGSGAIAMAIDAFSQGHKAVGIAYALTAVGSILLGLFAGDAQKQAKESDDQAD